MGVRISRSSWLSLAPLLRADGIVFWDTPDLPELAPSSGDRFIDVDSTYLGRLDLIAHDFYGDVNLWWAIALANNIDQIPTDMPIGTRLRIPDKQVVDAALSRGAR